MASAAHPQRRAVIDVGTNSVKLLVADLDATAVTPVVEVGEQTRLGRGFYDSHHLQSDAIALTAAVIAQFVGKAQALGAGSVRLFATSAARDARNADELKSAIREASGLDLCVISGETEAEWAFEGAMTNPHLAQSELLLVDVGGGSTEFILGSSGRRRFSASYRLGTVRTLEALSHSDPPKPGELAVHRQWIADALRAEIKPHLDPPLTEMSRIDPNARLQFAATGGTASILASLELGLTAFDRDRIEAATLTREIVEGWVERLWGMPLVERRQLAGLPPERADVMLAGVVIFESIMRAFGFKDLHVSTRGLRFAALRNLWNG